MWMRVKGRETGKEGEKEGGKWWERKHKGKWSQERWKTKKGNRQKGKSRYIDR